MSKLVVCTAILFVVSTAPAMAQTCNVTNVITAQGSLNNKVPGPPSLSSVATLRYTFGNDLTSDCDSDGGNGGVDQSVHQFTMRPSCNFVGNTCVNDPGGSDGDPLTPAVAFLLLDGTTCTGGLANITVDSDDPFSIKFNFAVALILPPNTSCSVDVTLHVRELGDATTPWTIAQQYAADGACLCSPELPAWAATTSALFLTCPLCSTNFCAPEHCDPTTSFPWCVADPAPDCANPDNDLCTSGSCEPAANGGSGGACVNGPSITCDDSNPCTDDTCNPATGCVHTPAPSPSEIHNVTVAADKATYTWSAASYATQYDVLRGSTGGFPVGAGSDEVCLDILAETSVSDPETPAPGNGFWYLFRGENSCGIGSWGDQSNGLPRMTTTCP